MNNIDSERLDQMREVLAWSNLHVSSVIKEPPPIDFVWSCHTPGKVSPGHTLYECILNAWVDAHPKP